MSVRLGWGFLRPPVRSELLPILFFLHIAGGVALILFGVRFLRKGLDRLLGDRLAGMMQRLASTRMRAFFAGLCAAVLAPSSTTMSVLAVQSVREGHLPPRRVLPLMLGADVGLTVMVLLVALRLDQYAPGFVALGVLGFQFGSHPRTRGVGQLLLSLGLIFLGISTISAAAHTVQPDGDLGRLLALATGHPVLLAALAAVLAVALQSSTATIGLGMGLSAAVAGADPLQLAVPMVIGANVGTGVTLLMLGWRQTDSRRLAVGNLLFKSTTAALALLLLGFVIDGLGALPLSADKRVAAAHSGFNLAMALLFLPLIGPAFSLVLRLVPEAPAEEVQPFGPKFIHNRHIEGSTIATGQSRQEILRASAIVRSMLDDTWTALLKRDRELARSVRVRDDQVDLLDTEVKRYLVQVAGADADEATAREVMGQLGFLNELETIGDVIDNNLSVLVMKRRSTTCGSATPAGPSSTGSTGRSPRTCSSPRPPSPPATPASPSASSATSSRSTHASASCGRITSSGCGPARSRASRAAPSTWTSSRT